MAAKAAKARARAAQKRRQVLSIAGAAVAVLVLIAGIVLLTRGGDSTTPAGSTGSTEPTATTPAPDAAFPALPPGADPALGTKPAVTAGKEAVPSLAVTTLIQGTGPAVQTGQTLTVNYVGVTYADGKEFDSSWSRSQTLDFKLGTGRVIKGWDQGLAKVKVGDRVQLDIPADLAYGTAPTDGSPAGILRFVVDVLAAK